jgi:hypothetical protein
LNRRARTSILAAEEVVDMESPDRVRSHSDAEDNACIDRRIEMRVQRYSGASQAEIGRRIRALEREWDIERWLETNASALALTGVLLAATRSRRWLVLPGVVSAFLLQHAVQGWCPPLPLLRSLGVRTRQEIDREKYALKALRGDFEASRNENRAAAALQAVED